MTQEEYILGEEPGEDDPARLWHDHNWSTDEVRFVSAYLRTGNAGRAYRETFPPEDEVDKIRATYRGQSMLRRPHVHAYVEHIQTMLKARLAVTQETVLAELAKLAFANMSDFVVLNSYGDPVTDLSGMTREQAASIQEMTIETYMDGRGEDAQIVKQVRIKLAPKIGALELIGKNLKMFTDVVEGGGVADVAEELRRARLERQQRQRERREENDGSSDD